MITAGSQRAGVAAGGKAELEDLRTHWGGGDSWNVGWVKAHPERDTERPASSWTDAERANVRADEAAEAAHAGDELFKWDEHFVAQAGGGRWRLQGGRMLEAPDVRLAWRRRSKALGLEYA